MQTYVFLDTNIFLHYQDFDQIKWSDVLGTGSITIVIPPVTVRELNSQKDSPQYPKKIKTRAGKTLIKLHNYFASSLLTKIKEELEIYLEDRDPLIDFTDNQLSWEIKDDHLIASIIMYRNEKPDSQFILVTSDSGLALMAKGKRHGIQVIKLDDSLRLKEEPDLDQEKIKELQLELDEIKRIIPKLSLVFADKSQHSTFTPKISIAQSEVDIEAKVASLKSQYPKFNEKPKDVPEKKPAIPTDFPASIAESLRNPLGIISQDDIAKYNADLDRFFEKYNEYLRRKVHFENQESNTIQLDIFLENDGTAPGEDIDIFMHFPDGFKIVKKLPSAPHEPTPPGKPKTQMEKLMESNQSLTRLIDFPVIHPPNYSNTPPNISSPSIKRIHSYEVNVHVQHIKHGFLEQLDPLFIIFDSYDTASSFHVDYRILAANVPTEISGQLHIVIQKQKQ